MGKSAGGDNIPAELVQAGGKSMIDILISVCNKIWKTGKIANQAHELYPYLSYSQRKAILQLCLNNKTISFISHSSTVILKIILNRLQPQAEEIIAEEQAGFRPGRSTINQIYNFRIICVKYLQYQQNLYHVFIYIKKTFDRVCHEALWTAKPL